MSCHLLSLFFIVFFNALLLSTAGPSSRFRWHVNIHRHSNRPWLFISLLRDLLTHGGDSRRPPGTPQSCHCRPVKRVRNFYLVSIIFSICWYIYVLIFVTFLAIFLLYKIIIVVFVFFVIINLSNFFLVWKWWDIYANKINEFNPLKTAGDNIIFSCLTSLMKAWWISSLTKSLELSARHRNIMLF